MSKYFTILLIAMLLPAMLIAGTAKKKRIKKEKEYITIEEESNLKEYNPNAVWQKVPCKHCDGTGSRTEQKFDAKKNSTKKWLVPCPYCKGSRYTGMSKM